MHDAHTRDRNASPPLRWWLALLLTAMGFALAPISTNGGEASKPSIRQLSTPFSPRAEARRSHRWRSAGRARAYSYMRGKAMNPWPYAKAKRMAHLNQLRSAKRRGKRYGIDVDQLLRTPGPAAAREEFAEVEALGIPVIPGVPPIIIIAPDNPEKRALMN